MAEVLEGSGQGQVVGLRGRGQDVVRPLGSLCRGGGQGEEAAGCGQRTGGQSDGFTLGGVMWMSGVAPPCWRSAAMT